MDDDDQKKKLPPSVNRDADNNGRKVSDSAQNEGDEDHENDRIDNASSGLQVGNDPEAGMSGPCARNGNDTSQEPPPKNVADDTVARRAGPKAPPQNDANATSSRPASSSRTESATPFLPASLLAEGMLPNPSLRLDELAALRALQPPPASDEPFRDQRYLHRVFRDVLFAIESNVHTVFLDSEGLGRHHLDSTIPAVSAMCMSGRNVIYRVAFNLLVQNRRRFLIRHAAFGSNATHGVWRLVTYFEMIAIVQEQSDNYIRGTLSQPQALPTGDMERGVFMEFDVPFDEVVVDGITRLRLSSISVENHRGHIYFLEIIQQFFSSYQSATTPQGQQIVLEMVKLKIRNGANDVMFLVWNTEQERLLSVQNDEEDRQDVGRIHRVPTEQEINEVIVEYLMDPNLREQRFPDDDDFHDGDGSDQDPYDGDDDNLTPNEYSVTLQAQNDGTFRLSDAPRLQNQRLRQYLRQHANRYQGTRRIQQAVVDEMIRSLYSTNFLVGVVGGTWRRATPQEIHRLIVSHLSVAQNPPPQPAPPPNPQNRPERFQALRFNVGINEEPQFDRRQEERTDEDHPELARRERDDSFDPSPDAKRRSLDP